MILSCFCVLSTIHQNVTQRSCFTIEDHNFKAIENLGHLFWELLCLTSYWSNEPISSVAFSYHFFKYEVRKIKDKWGCFLEKKSNWQRDHWPQVGLLTSLRVKDHWLQEELLSLYYILPKKARTDTRTRNC